MLLKTAIWTVARLLAASSTPPAPVTADDKVGWSMTCLRAIETGSMKGVDRCCSTYPHLRTILGPTHLDLHSDSDRMTALRDHIVSLARDRITDDLSSLQQDISDPNDPVRRQKKEKPF